MQQQDKKKRIAGYVILAILACSALVGGWLWLRETLYFDAYTTKASSGWITSLIEKFGDKWNIPFVTIYGITQPLLPAAIFEPSLAFWVAIAIIRGLAWYAVLPILLFGVFEIWKDKKEKLNLIIALLLIVFALWVVVSSARAGGDLWDNPRYRFILLPYMSLVIAWSIERYQLTHSRWLWRWAAVIGTFLLFFMNFYANRYLNNIGLYIHFAHMVGLIAIISVLILGTGFIMDLIRKKKKLDSHG